MKKVAYIFLALALVLSAVSCAKEDHAKGLTVTYYPVFELTGGSTYAHQVGTKWAEPGISAVVNGEDVTDKLVIDDTVDGSTSGVYTVTYSYTNEDGFVNSKTRTVVVYDIASASSTDISGTYSASCLMYKTTDGSLVRDWGSAYGLDFPLKITNGPARGLFYIQDLYIGLYESYAGYGSAYAFRAFILLNSDNTISMLSASDPFNRGGVSTYPGGATGYDPVTGNVTVDWLWGNYGTTYHFVTTYKK